MNPRATSVTTALISLLAQTFGLAACGSSGYPGPKPGEFGPGRTAVVVTWAIENGEATSHPDSTVAPLVVGVMTDSTTDFDKDFTSKGDYAHDPIDVMTEISFGDGSGWQDITAWVLDERFDYNWFDGVDPAGTVQHTYTAAGDYTIDARVTYWDGEVVYAHDSNQDVVVHVTESQAAVP